MPIDISEEILDRVQSSIRLSLSVGLSSDRIAQKKVYRKAIDFYKCNSEAHLEDILSDLFAEYEEVKDEIIFREMGVTKGIVDNIALVYREEPERIFVNETGNEISDGALKDYLYDIYSNIGNTSFQLYERLVTAMSHCSVQVFWNREKERVEMFFLTPDKYDVIVDPIHTAKATAFLYQVDTQDDMTDKQYNTVYYYVDEFQILRVKVFIQYAQNTISTTTVNKITVVGVEPFLREDALATDEYFSQFHFQNPYGIIPIITTTSEVQIMDFFVDVNARLFTTGEAVIITKDVSANDTSFNQGFPILVHTRNNMGAIANVSDKVIVSPKYILNAKNGKGTGQPAEKFEYIQPNADLSGLNQDISDTFLQIAAIFGLNESEGNVKANASGISLVVSDDKKNKLINASRGIYAKFEEEFFDMARTINNASGGLNIPENIKVITNFKEIETVVNPSDRLSEKQFDIDNQMKPKYQILMEDDPEMTEEVAKAQIAEAQEEQAQGRAMLVEMTSPDNEEFIEEDTEEDTTSDEVVEDEE